MVVTRVHAVGRFSPLPCQGNTIAPVAVGASLFVAARALVGHRPVGVPVNAA